MQGPVHFNGPLDEGDNNNDPSKKKGSEIGRASPALFLRFDGREFLPSAETPLGSALLNRLALPETTNKDLLRFKESFLVDLCIGSGAAFTKEPVEIIGFALAKSSSGTPAIVHLLAVEGKEVGNVKKLLLPIVLVVEQDGEWRLEKTDLGWNREITRDPANQGPSARRVNFKDDGVFLVVSPQDHEGIVPMPFKIHSLQVNDQGKVLKAESKDGRIFQPPTKAISLDIPLQPPMQSHAAKSCGCACSSSTAT
jgi:hypothetical protein